MKYNRTLPKDEGQKKFPIIGLGFHKFQITDIHSEDEENIVAKCEVIGDDDSKGISLLYRVANNPDSQFFWLTKLFLKCIGEPCEGDVTIDTDAWIGRQFSGEIKHSEKDGKTYANIKKLVYKDEPQAFTRNTSVPKPETDNIVWEN
jgi:hypothetical protein